MGAVCTVRDDSGDFLFHHSSADETEAEEGPGISNFLEGR